MRQNWARLEAALPPDEHWYVWIDWYEDRLAGRERSEKHEMIFALVPKDEWKKGPAAANQWIAAELAKLRPKDRPDDSYDFFLSYSKKDEAFTKFADAMLRGAGYRVFAQFRDMPVGSNFVREMNKGLANSSRFIALLSPDYVASRHCQAEWAAAYNDDPDSAKRNLVSFSIEPADLEPLAKQIVYKSLIGLSREDAAKAILDAIGHTGPAAAPDAPWPGARALDEMTKPTRGVFDVAPDAGNRLRPKPIPINDDVEKTYGFSKQDLYLDMRQAVVDFAHHVQNHRAGNFSFSERLKLYAQALLIAAPQDHEHCSPLAINRALIAALRAMDLDEQAGELSPKDMILHHRAELRGLYQRLAALYSGLVAYRETCAKDRFTLPDEDASQAIDDILSATARDAKVASPELAAELAKTEAALTAARAASPTGSPEQKRENQFEPHKSAAAQIIPVWNWLANAKEKFARTGKTAEETSRAIESYEKLYKKLSNAKDYFDWLSGWFY